MNRLVLALLLTASPIALAGCGEARSEPRADDAQVQATAASESPAGSLQPIALRVPDMSCRLCARPIEKNLRAMGLQDVKADLETKWVTARFDPARTSPEAIRAQVEGLKFRVTEVRAG